MRNIIGALELVGLNYWRNSVEMPVTDGKLCLYRKICQRGQLPVLQYIFRKNVKMSWLSMVEPKHIGLVNVQLENLYQDCAAESKLETDKFAFLLHRFYSIFFWTSFSH